MDEKPTPTIRLVALAMDGSEHAMAALRWIESLPLPKSCTIAVLSVLIPRNAQHFARLDKLLEQTRLRLEQFGHRVETHLLSGYPADQIVQFSEERQPDLIVMGATGLRSTLGILLGGVAQQVVEYASCPVLIVRAPHTQARRVLIAIDGSESSRWALRHLQACPIPGEAQIVVVHVLPPEITPEALIHSWPYGMETMPPLPTPDIEESLAKRAQEEEQQGQALLEETLAELSKMGIVAEGMLKRGDAATEIIQVAKEKESDLIVAGSRGLNPIRSWLLGSVSRKLLHYAPCSVLVVRMPKETTS